MYTILHIVTYGGVHKLLDAHLDEQQKGDFSLKLNNFCRYDAFSFDNHLVVD